MKRLLLFLLGLLTALATGLQSGCKTSEVAGAAFRIGVRMAVYEAARKNPDLRPYLHAMAAGFRSPGSPIDLGALDDYVASEISRIGDPALQMSALEIANLAMGSVRDLLKVHGERMTEGDVSAVLDEMGRVMQQALILAPASQAGGQPSTVSTSVGRIVID